MKKIFYSILMLAMAAFTFTSCEDVPAPYDIPDSGTGTETPGETIEPAGSGTAEDPYNVAAALQQIKALDASTEIGPMYVKGKISSIRQVETSQYGNANYYISDDGSDDQSTRLYIFQSYYLGNVKFTSEDQIKAGDEVVIYGKFVNYQGNTPETVGKGTSYIYSLNGQTSGGNVTPPVTGEAKGDGTLENPFNSVAANQLASSLPADAQSDVVYVKGKIVSIKENFTATYGNAAFYISDDGTSTDQFYVFRTLYLNNEKYTAGDVLSVGDEVVICGKLTNYYGNTPETVQNESYLYSWTKGEGGNTGGDTGDQTASNGDFEAWTGGQPTNWTTASTAGNATLSQSTDAHGGKYSVQVGGTSSANKRLGYKEIELKAGEYTMTFYAKAATATGASVRPGYVQVTDGKVGNYMYGDYTNNITNSNWVSVTHTFTIDADGTYCLVIMNSKNPGADVLIDDFTLTMGGNAIIK